MDEHQIELQPLLWAVGWLVAVLVLFWAGLRLPLQTRLGRWLELALHRRRGRRRRSRCSRSPMWRSRCNDGHIDLTREKIYTPSAAAMEVVDGLGREVRVTYFYHSQDPAGRRARDILQLMQRRNPLFTAHRGRSRQGADGGAHQWHPHLQRRR